MFITYLLPTSYLPFIILQPTYLPIHPLITYLHINKLPTYLPTCPLTWIYYIPSYHPPTHLDVLPTYILTNYLPTYPTAYLHGCTTYLPTHTPIYIHVLPTYPSTYLHTYYPPTHLPIYLPTFPRTYLPTPPPPTYLHIHPPTYLLQPTDLRTSRSCSDVLK